VKRMDDESYEMSLPLMPIKIVHVMSFGHWYNVQILKFSILDARHSYLVYDFTNVLNVHGCPPINIYDAKMSRYYVPRFLICVYINSPGHVSCTRLLNFVFIFHIHVLIPVCRTTSMYVHGV